MKMVLFDAKCPFEIGDKVKLPNGRVKTITDIQCSHFLSERKVIFSYELDHCGLYVMFENVNIEKEGMGKQ